MHCKAHNAGFSLIELCVCVALIAVLTTLTYPALSKARLASKQTKSLSNLRMIGQALLTYVADNGGYFPLLSGTNANATSFTSPVWCQTPLAPYLPPAPGSSRSPVLLDPLLGSGHSTISDYAANSEILHSAVAGYSPSPNPQPIAAIGARSAQIIMVLAAEDAGRALPNGTWYIGSNSNIPTPMPPWARPSDRGTGKIMAVFVDGHTEAVDQQLFNSDRATRRNYLLINP